MQWARVITCNNGKMVEVEKVLECSKRRDKPFCCQAGKPGEEGAARCLRSAEECQPWTGLAFMIQGATMHPAREQRGTLSLRKPVPAILAFISHFCLKQLNLRNDQVHVYRLTADRK